MAEVDKTPPEEGTACFSILIISLLSASFCNLKELKDLLQGWG